MGRISDALKRAQHERSRRMAAEKARQGAVATLATEPTVARLDDVAMEWSADVPALTRGGHETGEDIGIAGTVNTRAGRNYTGEDTGATGLGIGGVDTARPLTPIQREPLPAECVSREVLALHDTASAMAERLRSLRTRLMTSYAGAARILAISSSQPGEGKSVTTANLAFSLAELRSLRVGMIDLDFRRKGLSRLLKCEDQPGVADVLRGEKTLAEVCLPVTKGNLCLVPAGAIEQLTPGELLASERTAALFREFSERFHFTLVDTPPISTAADVNVIGRLLSGVIVVVRMHRTPEPLLQRCVRLLQANRVPVTGCVLVGCSEDGSAGDGSEALTA